MNRLVRRLVSGGQSGADRAALDVAAELGIPRGGWCPAGGLAEDFPDPPGLLAAYPELREAPSPEPDVRTRLNVRDSDATLVVTDAEPTGGTALTVTVAHELGRPVLLADGDDAEQVTDWLRELARQQARPPVLNVAGPRESTRPRTYARTRALLLAVLS